MSRKEAECPQLKNCGPGKPMGDSAGESQKPWLLSTVHAEGDDSDDEQDGDSSANVTE